MIEHGANCAGSTGRLSARYLSIFLNELPQSKTPGALAAHYNMNYKAYGVIASAITALFVTLRMIT